MTEQNKTVIEIIKQHLIDNGFDGLYNLLTAARDKE